MTKSSVSFIVTLLVLSSGVLLAAPASQAGQSRNTGLGAHSVNVNISFNIQMPMDSIDETAIIAAQRRGRALIYRLAKGECEELLEEIAETCRLVSLNAATNIPQVHNANPLYINLSGNAQFAISLKSE